MKYRILISTVPNEKAALTIARHLLRKKVCACVNVIPAVSSFYWWKGKLDSAKEVLLLIKTTQSRVKELIRLLKKLHPYEIPEIISVEIKGGLKPYLDWISEGCNAESAIFKIRNKKF